MRFWRIIIEGVADRSGWQVPRRFYFDPPAEKPNVPRYVAVIGLIFLGVLMIALIALLIVVVVAGGVFFWELYRLITS